MYKIILEEVNIVETWDYYEAFAWKLGAIPGSSCRETSCLIHTYVIVQ